MQALEFIKKYIGKSKLHRIRHLNLSTEIINRYSSDQFFKHYAFLSENKIDKHIEYGKVGRPQYKYFII